MPKFEDLTGLKFNFLEVIKRAESNPYGATMWECKCVCGGICVARANRLKDGKTKHCGCMTKLRNITHGMTKTKEWTAYHAIHARCYNPSNPQYKDYGARGIGLCQRWSGINGCANFIKDMGLAPSKHHTLERVDVNGIYEPTNCKWATWAEQSKNKRNSVYLEYGSEKFILNEWAKKLAIPKHRIRKYISQGFGISGMIQKEGINYQEKPFSFPIINYSFGFIN